MFNKASLFFAGVIGANAQQFYDVDPENTYDVGTLMNLRALLDAPQYDPYMMNLATIENTADPFATGDEYDLEYLAEVAAAAKEAAPAAKKKKAPHAAKEDKEAKPDAAKHHTKPHDKPHKKKHHEKGKKDAKPAGGHKTDVVKRAVDLINAGVEWAGRVTGEASDAKKIQAILNFIRK